MSPVHATSPCPSYWLRFASLRMPGDGYSFPCDASGQVDLDGLTEEARNTYFFARTVVGAEFARPMVTSSS